MLAKFILTTREAIASASAGVFVTSLFNGAMGLNDMLMGALRGLGTYITIKIWATTPDREGGAPKHPLAGPSITTDLMKTHIAGTLGAYKEFSKSSPDGSFDLGRDAGPILYGFAEGAATAVGLQFMSKAIDQVGKIVNPAAQAPQAPAAGPGRP